MRQLHAHGCNYLQFDDSSLAYLNDSAQREHISNLGGHGKDQYLTYIKLINRALAQKLTGMIVCGRGCGGNRRSSLVACGGYDYIAEALFNVDGFFLEYDDSLRRLRAASLRTRR